MKAVAALLLTVACASAPKRPDFLAPTLSPTSREATAVGAPFARTWTAAVDVFAESNVPIETIDRSSGLLVPAQNLFLGGRADTTYADCGQKLEPLGGAVREPMARIAYEYRPIVPRGVRYNVRVNGDSLRSTVQVHAFYSNGGACVSKGKWEAQFEQAIKARAERAR